MAEVTDIAMLRVPVLVILGATGSGKSRLSIELAQKFAGEIISADSMQVYKGLDIVTAKVTKEERSQARHHVLDFLDPLCNFTVLDFRNKALPIVNNLLSRKILPIIVGGTNYYIESLLWQVLVEEPAKFSEDNLVSNREKKCPKVNSDEGEGARCENSVNVVSSGSICCDGDGGNNGGAGGSGEKLEFRKSEGEQGSVREAEDEEVGSSKRIKFDDDSVTNEQLYQRLLEIDPEKARTLHPNNRRKIERSLQVYEKFGTRHSEILKTQRLGGSSLGGPLRYDNSIILWLRCDQKALDVRLDERVDDMVKAGLVQELLDFHEKYNQDRIKANELTDYTKGIFQNIGMKELHNYLILSKEERSCEKGLQLLKQGIEDMKVRTRKYARKQHRWIENRFIRTDRQVPPMYSLDCTHVNFWNEHVLEPAIAIVSSHLKGETPAQRPINENNINEDTLNVNKEAYHYCEICEKTLIGDLQWTHHTEGMKHQRVARRKKRLADQLQ